MALTRKRNDPETGTIKVVHGCQLGGDRGVGWPGELHTLPYLEAVARVGSGQAVWAKPGEEPKPRRRRRHADETAEAAEAPSPPEHAAETE